MKHYYLLSLELDRVFVKWGSSGKKKNHWLPCLAQGYHIPSLAKLLQKVNYITCVSEHASLVSLPGLFPADSWRTNEDNVTLLWDLNIQKIICLKVAISKGATDDLIVLQMSVKLLTAAQHIKAWVDWITIYYVLVGDSYFGIVRSNECRGCDSVLFPYHYQYETKLK